MTKWFALCVVLAACAEQEARVRQARAPNGDAAWSIECGHNRAVCEDELKEMCNGRAQILKDTGNEIIVRCP